MVGGKTRVADEDASIYKQAIAWMLGQEFNNVLLIGILCAMGSFGWFGVPIFISELNGHLTRIEERHREERLAIEKLHTEQIRVVIDLVREKKSRESE